MSLIARYKLDGNARDSEGTAHGTAIDVTWAPSQLVDGGGEARLDGTTSRIETGVTFTTETAVSLPVWFRPHEGSGHLIGQHDGTNGLAIEQTETGKIRLVVNGTASAEVAIYPGEYHHAVMVYDNGEATLYLDNEAVASLTETVTWPAEPVTIGARADGSAALACDVVDIRGFSSALSEGEVQQLLYSPDLKEFDPDFALPPVEQEVARYEMDKQSGSLLEDLNGDNDASLHNTGWVIEEGRAALTFNGSSSRGTIAGSLVGESDELTFGLFFKTPSLQSSVLLTLPSSGQSASGWDNWIELLDTGEIRYSIRNIEGLRVYTDVSVPTYHDDQWHHVAVSFDGKEKYLYFDGVLMDSQSHAGSVAMVGTNKRIGCRHGADGNFYSGLVSSIRIFDVAINENEASAIRDGVEAGILFPYFSFRQVAVETLSDAYNPHPTPIPNPTAIPRSGRSTVQDTPDPVKALGFYDQVDGSGGKTNAPHGVASDPARRGIIEGNTTDENGQPVSRRVRAFERKSGRIVRETWSNSAGFYRFEELDPNKRFTIVAHDYTGEWNAVIADNVTPEVQ